MNRLEWLAQGTVPVADGALRVPDVLGHAVPHTVYPPLWEQAGRQLPWLAVSVYGWFRRRRCVGGSVTVTRARQRPTARRSASNSEVPA